MQRLPSAVAILTVGALVVATPAKAQFNSSNATLRSQISLTDFGQGDGNGNDCWGYVSSSGREYALMGLEGGMSVVEITDPNNAVIIGRIDHTTSLWADIKVFGDHCYVVNESGGGLQVVDLSQVDSGTVTLVRSIFSRGLSSSHNVALDEDSGFLYTCGSNTNSGLGGTPFS